MVPGFSYTVTNSIGDISAVLNALSEESLLNIISTPSVMVLDNHTAYMHVGQQVPIIDQQSTSSASDNSSVATRYTNGNIHREQSYKDGEPHGEWTSWDRDQNLLFHRTYDEGQQIY